MLRTVLLDVDVEDAFLAGSLLNLGKYEIFFTAVMAWLVRKNSRLDG